MAPMPWLETLLLVLDSPVTNGTLCFVIGGLVAEIQHLLADTPQSPEDPLWFRC